MRPGYKVGVTSRELACVHSDSISCQTHSHWTNNARHLLSRFAFELLSPFLQVNLLGRVEKNSIENSSRDLRDCGGFVAELSHLFGVARQEGHNLFLLPLVSYFSILLILIFGSIWVYPLLTSLRTTLRVSIWDKWTVSFIIYLDTLTNVFYHSKLSSAQFAFRDGSKHARITDYGRGISK